MQTLPQVVNGHSTFSPSRTAQQRLCPGSVWAQAHLAEEVSDAAEEGRRFHEAMEAVLNGGPIPADIAGDEEMCGHVETCKAHVLNIEMEMGKAGATPLRLVEAKVSCSASSPDGYAAGGTADCVVIGGGTMHVIDWKYGRGIAVSPDENDQLLRYAGGVLETYREEAGGVRDVVLTIGQPRLPNAPPIKWWEIPRRTVEELMPVIKEELTRCLDPDAPRIPGYSQCRNGFCRAAANCPALFEVAKEGVMGLVQDDRPNTKGVVERMDPAERALVLAKADLVKFFLKENEEQAIADIQRGVSIPGWKLVEGRTVRKPVPGAQEMLAGLVGEERAYVRKMPTIAEVERMIGKEAAAPLYHKPPGTPAVVPESDKRPSIMETNPASNAPPPVSDDLIFS